MRAHCVASQSLPVITYSSDPAIQKSLKHSLRDGSAFAVMTGVGETYISAFAVFLKATTPQIGLLASVPPLLASLVQLFSAWLGHVTGHRKAIILIGASLQALAWLPIVALPLLFTDLAVPLLIGSVILYHAGAHLTAPQWTGMMGDIVPERKRGRFFSQRTRRVAATTFVSLLAGGSLLHFMNQRGETVAGFILLFTVAALARGVSVYHLAQMQDPAHRHEQTALPAGREWWSRMRNSNAVRFSIFVALMQFAVAIASPFFTVYMLRDLHFTYLQFTMNTGMAIFAQFLTLAQWGRISDVFGNRRILAVTGIFIPLMPLLWTFSTNFWYLLAIQLFSGFSWAGFSLSSSNYLYDLVAPGRRTAYIAAHNVVLAGGVFCGAILGGYLGVVLPQEVTVLGTSYSWLSTLYGVFVISTLARGAVALLLIPRLREVRQVRHISTANVIFRVTRMNALAGMFFDIVGVKSDKQGDKE
ncbi:MAG: MFS transporter [Woeseia sp.]